MFNAKADVPECNVLFQADVHRTRASRAFFGVFTSEVLAINHAKENGLYIHTAEVLIIEC